MIKPSLLAKLADTPIYTGIGSRETPAPICDTMERIGYSLGSRGILLRSGGAHGADLAFETGCDASETGRKEIFVPWNGFNGIKLLYPIPDEAFEMASKLHPAWHRLTLGARKMHARNCMQVLGPNLDTPTGAVICWTKDGKDVGGTRTAIVLARQYNIPVINLALPS